MPEAGSIAAVGCEEVRTPLENEGPKRTLVEGVKLKGDDAESCRGFGSGALATTELVIVLSDEG